MVLNPVLRDSPLKVLFFGPYSRKVEVDRHSAQDRGHALDQVTDAVLLDETSRSHQDGAISTALDRRYHRAEQVGVDCVGIRLDPPARGDTATRLGELFARGEYQGCRPEQDAEQRPPVRLADHLEEVRGVNRHHQRFLAQKQWQYGHDGLERMRVDDVGVEALAQRGGNRGESVDDPAESALLRHVNPIDGDASALDLVGRRVGLRSRGHHRDRAPLVGEAMAKIVDMVLDATETRWVVDRGHQYFHRRTHFDR